MNDDWINPTMKQSSLTFGKNIYNYFDKKNKTLDEGAESNDEMTMTLELKMWFLW